MFNIASGKHGVNFNFIIAYNVFWWSRVLSLIKFELLYVAEKFLNFTPGMNKGLLLLLLYCIKYCKVMPVIKKSSEVKLQYLLLVESKYEVAEITNT